MLTLTDTMFKTTRSFEKDFSVGRHKDAGLSTLMRNVSRQHAVITRGVDGWFVIDSGSTNGTTVNGECVHAPTMLRNGDKVSFGGWEFEVSV